MRLLHNYMDAMLTVTPRKTIVSNSATIPKTNEKLQTPRLPLTPDIMIKSKQVSTKVITESPPQRLSDLKIIKTLAPALFGEVLLCLDSTTSRQLAVKRLDLHCARAQVTIGEPIQVVENLQQERAVHRQLVEAQTTNLLLLEEEIQCGNNLYLVFPFCSGGDLFDVVRQSPSEGRLPETTARQFLRDVVRGLLSMKENGLAHRDISLENVLLDAQGVCYVCDFGLAIDHDKFAAPGRVGKVWYMDPEVFAANESYCSLAADIWSLGILFAIMLSGAPLVEYPTCDDCHFRVLRYGGGIRKLRHTFPRNLSDQAFDLMEKLLQIKPSERLTLEQVVDHPFLIV